MADHTIEQKCGFREIVINSRNIPRWKEITINTGGSASTLQDLKVPDTAGGFTYQNSGDTGATSNRFIYWRCVGDTLEMVEESLDHRLTNNHLRLRFLNTPILNGVGVYEYRGSVVILVATVTSVHRLLFPHPSKMHNSLDLASAIHLPTRPSIFADASLTSIQDPRNVHMINESSSSNLPYFTQTAGTWLTREGEAIFVYVTNMATLLIMKMPPFGIQGVVTQHQISQSSVIHRLWSGIVPAAIRGSQEPAEMPLSLCVFSLHDVACVASLCKDHKLRLWSLKKDECVLVYDMLETIGATQSLSKQTTTGSGHVIKASLDSGSDHTRLAVYLNLANVSQVVILEPECINGRYQLTFVTSCISGDDDMVDFCVTSTRIWLLSNDKSGHPIVKTTTLNSEGAVRPWLPVFLELPFSSDILLPTHKDPRQVYMDLIFHPSHFSTGDIHKALVNYRKSLDMQYADLEMTIGQLKDYVSAAVETEIQNCVGGCEITEEEYYQLQVTEWSRFYSGCIQYNKIGAKAKGLMVDSITGLTCIIKKANLSYISPCDIIDLLYSTTSTTDTSSMLPITQAFDPSVTDSSSLQQLFVCLRLIGDNIPEDIAAELDLSLEALEPPELIVDRLIAELIYSDRTCDDLTGIGEEILLALQLIPDLVAAVTAIHSLLDISPDVIDDALMEQDSHQPPSTHLASDLASDVISVSLSHFIQSRYTICRDLLIFEKAAILFLSSNRTDYDVNIKNSLIVDFIPSALSLLHCYFTMNALSHCLVNQPPNTIDFHLRQLSALDLSDSAAHIASSDRFDYNKNETIVELFIRGIGGLEARRIVADDSDHKHLWVDTLGPYTLALAQFLWPISANFLFPEFLLSHCQFVCIEQYVHWLRDWCGVNVASRHFLLAHAYLNSNEPYKAMDCFTMAKSGVMDEEFLCNKLLQREADDNLYKLQVLYYLKVIELFEQFNTYDVTVSLANAAIAVAQSDDPNLPTLWSKVFKYQIELGHYKEAYEAMTSNPDSSRCKDCLRQFIVVLCEKRQLQTLIHFPYVDLHDEVVETLETKARSVDLSLQNYYDLLYSFHISRGNYRTAGSVMYEHGMRLGQELPTIDGLQRQAKCYLAALNALRLVNPDYAWVIKPTHANRKAWDDPSTVTSKRFSDGEQKPYSKRKIEILEMGDIEKEYLLVNAKLKLKNQESDSGYSGGVGGVHETVGQLANACLFDRAIILCRAFSLPLVSILETLAMRCISLSQYGTFHAMGDNSYVIKAWDWLAENDIGRNYVVKDASSASNQAWRLLESYLQTYDDTSCRLHHCVAIKLLSHGFPLPSWFITSYKKRNAPELLGLYMAYDHLEEATQLCVEYIDAVWDVTRGQDRDMFGLSGMITPLPQSVWLPYTYIDQLLCALEQISTDIIYTKLGSHLRSKVSDYQSHLEKLQKLVLHREDVIM